MTMAFVKYEGLGNDFVVVAAPPDALSPDDARRICDRHFGVGADGVLIVAPPTDGGVARMIVLNADGSRPEMCGNGLRCVAAFVGHGSPDAAFVVETDAGPKRCTVEGGLVEIEMGFARELGSVVVEIGGETLSLANISMGNPHAITFDPFPRFLELGLAVATHSVFPSGTNFEVSCQTGPREIDLVVWERGVGLTLACGTGACAVVASACAPFASARTRAESDAVTAVVSPTATTAARAMGASASRGSTRSIK